MTGRTTLITVGAFALAMLGFAAVAKADEPSGPGGPNEGPDPEDCDTLRAQLQSRQAYRSALIQQRISLQQALQDAPGDPGIQGQLQEVDGMIYNVDSDIAQINAGLSECS